MAQSNQICTNRGPHHSPPDGKHWADTRALACVTGYLT